MREYIDDVNPVKRGSFFDFDFTDIDGKKVDLRAALKK